MKHITKILFVILATVSFSAVNAGELTVTGSAQASYAITSSDSAGANLNRAKGVGVENDMSFGASGELDNGFTWSYSNDFDSGTSIDDSALKITTPYGMIAFFSDEGGVGSDVGWNASVVARPSDTSFNELMAGEYDASALNNIQYSTPAGLIPFDTVIDIAHAPGTETSVADADAQGEDSVFTTYLTTTATNLNTAGTGVQTTEDMGSSLTQYRVTTVPLEGLTVGASYSDVDHEGHVMAQAAESGSWYAKYSIGSITAGVGEVYIAYPVEAAADGASVTNVLEDIKGQSYSIAFAVNDDLSVSYTNEKSKPSYQTNATAAYEMQSSGLQAAYTMGGMTLSIAMNEHENATYTQNYDIKDTIFKVSMAF
jgi:hypothetical protein